MEGRKTDPEYKGTLKETSPLLRQERTNYELFIQQTYHVIDNRYTSGFFFSVSIDR